MLASGSNSRLAESLLKTKVPQVMNAALAGVDGMSDFVFRENTEAGGILPREVNESGKGSPIEMVSLRTLMECTGVARLDLLKLDIEDAEFDLIQKPQTEFCNPLARSPWSFMIFCPK